jgi:ubiquinone/menaquinone biosynthesis C-methylase UbiE
MRGRDLVALLERGVEPGPYDWADLGAGEGNFTLALAQLLGPGARIIALDKHAGPLRTFRDSMGAAYPEVAIDVVGADFTRPLDLHDLDGVLMANSLHFVRDKRPVLDAVLLMLKPGGRLIVVEYATDRGNPWVPHPFSFETWQRMAAAAGFMGTEQIGSVPSSYFGSMYSALSRRPET